MGNLFDIFGNQTPIEDESEKQNNALEQQKQPLIEEQDQNSQIEAVLNLDKINIQEYLQINLEAFKLTKQNLIDGFGQILMYLDFHKEPNLITPLQMKVFAGELALRYRDNIYHNFRHGFSVFQFTFVLFIKSETVLNLIPRNEQLAHLIACFAHDVEHPGVNNVFLKNQQHELSIKYNQVSILENHHASVLFHLLNNNRSNILKSYPEKDQKQLRKQIIQSILATDPARHFEVIDNFQKFKGQLDNQQKRQYFLDYMLHAADIHNPALKWELASK